MTKICENCFYAICSGSDYPFCENKQSEYYGKEVENEYHCEHYKESDAGGYIWR